VETISVSLFCSDSLVDTSVQVPISDDGDARIRDRLDLPATCLEPSMFVHPNGVTGVYIAISGWRF
jgi:hypothetical protein